MAIFPIIKTEATVQTGDLTRIDATKSIATVDEAAISKVEIEPLASNGYIDVTGSDSEDWYLDWVYDTEETVTVSIRITTDGSPTTETDTISIVTSATDNLFTDDDDILEHEPDVLQFLRPGRTSFLDYHRAAKIRILEWLDERRLTDDEYSVDELKRRVLMDHPDMMFKDPYDTTSCPDEYYEVMMFLDNTGKDRDWHFYRRDADGYWSHKPGGTNATKYDDSGKLITDPIFADRDYEKMKVPYNYDVPVFRACVSLKQ